MFLLQRILRQMRMKRAVDLSMKHDILAPHVVAAQVAPSLRSAWIAFQTPKRRFLRPPWHHDRLRHLVADFSATDGEVRVAPLFFCSDNDQNTPLSKMDR